MTADRPLGCVLALLIGIAIPFTVAAISGHLAYVLGERDEWGPMLSMVCIAGSPFAALAIYKVRSRRPWLVGLAITAAFWGWLLYRVSNYAGGGADIGAGLIMFVSPLIVLIGALLAQPKPEEP